MKPLVEQIVRQREFHEIRAFGLHRKRCERRARLEQVGLRVVRRPVPRLRDVELRVGNADELVEVHIGLHEQRAVVRRLAGRNARGRIREIGVREEQAKAHTVLLQHVAYVRERPLPRRGPFTGRHGRNGQAHARRVLARLGLRLQQRGGRRRCRGGARRRAASDRRTGRTGDTDRTCRVCRTGGTGRTCGLRSACVRSRNAGIRRLRRVGALGSEQ
jgi:hypothetical protein